MTKGQKAAKFLNSESYLQQFWPKDPKSTSVWKENKWLLEQYVACAKILNNTGHRNLKAVEISAGPILAPLIPFTYLFDEIQLSDYDSTNREILSKGDISYWSDYIKEIFQIEKEHFDNEKLKNRLQKLDELRSKSTIAYVDIKRESKQIFNPPLVYTDYNFYIMHFVVDSITDSKDSYFELLESVIRKTLKKSDLFLMSALVECTTWDDGEKTYPAANTRTTEIITELELLGLKIIFSNEKIHKAGIGHDGGFAVILSQYI